MSAVCLFGRLSVGLFYCIINTYLSVAYAVIMCECDLHDSKVAFYLLYCETDCYLV